MCFRRSWARVHKGLANTKSAPSTVIATSLVVGGWGYLIYTGTISTIWPLFGTGNQLLATIALAITTTFLINMGKAGTRSSRPSRCASWG